MYNIIIVITITKTNAKEKKKQPKSGSLFFASGFPRLAFGKERIALSTMFPECC